MFSKNDVAALAAMWTTAWTRVAEEVYEEAERLAQTKVGETKLDRDERSRLRRDIKTTVNTAEREAVKQLIDVLS